MLISSVQLELLIHSSQNTAISKLPDMISEATMA